MNCSCIRHGGSLFDYHLEMLDCDTIIFTDLSNWMQEDYYEVPNSWPMTVTSPSGDKFTVNFKPMGTTVIRSEDLGGCILDGIYCFSTESCGYIYSRSEAIMCSLQCKLDTLLAFNEDYDRIGKISNYIDSIKINARVNKVKLAESMFKIVQRELKSVECL